MSKGRRRADGFLMAELIVTFTLLSLIVAGLAVSIHGFGLFNRYQLARQQCIAAAQAQLDSITARAVTVEAAECERLWPGVQISVERHPGTGSWAGLQRVEVTATAQAGPRQAKVQLARYVQPNEGDRSL